MTVDIGGHPFTILPDGIVIDEIFGKVAPPEISKAVRQMARQGVSRPDMGRLTDEMRESGQLSTPQNDITVPRHRTPVLDQHEANVITDNPNADMNAAMLESEDTGSPSAAMAATSAIATGATGAAGSSSSGAPMSYEEFLRQRFEQLDKEREKEKWLSIAMAGAQILASDNPTLGGAIGEGLMAGLGHSAQSRKQLSDEEMALQKQMYKAQLARQALAARGSGRSGGGSSASSSRMSGSLPTSLADNFLKEYADLAEREAELDAMLRSGYMKSDYGYEPLDEGARAAIRSELENISNIKSRYSMMLEMPDIDLTQVAPNTTMQTQSTPALPKDR